METKHSKDMVAMEEKLQVLLRVMLNQSNTSIDMGDLGAFLSTQNDDNNVRHSSTSTHAPNNHESIMKFTVKTLKGSNFEIRVHPFDFVKNRSMGGEWFFDNSEEEDEEHLFDESEEVDEEQFFDDLDGDEDEE
ncbi:hypothetical protein MTR_2g077010 [Medicago truncatula]|uniref:Uncharacterized protein n=1 Tax=Medicago truncatula TaxID=3880 RepID=G7IJF5_MEDTR|nr:hypothetical protein MTR_2g077010 [Medicago truncatula]